MKITSFITSLKILFFLTLLLNIGLVQAQENSEGNQPKTVNPEDYEKWEALRGSSISKSGQYIHYQVNTVNQDQTTYLYNRITGESNSFPNTARAVFSADEKWMAFNIVPSGKEAEANEKNKEKSKKPPVKNALVINLKTKDSIELNDIASYSFSPHNSLLAIKRVKEKSSSLVIKDLQTGQEVTFGNISSFSWQQKGNSIAMIVENKGDLGNAVHLYNTKLGTLKALDHKDVKYSGLRWLKETNHLFVLRQLEKESHINESYEFLLWKNLGSKKSTFHLFNQDNFNNFPSDTRILNSRISLSDDGDRIFFNTFSWNSKPGNDKKEDKTQEKEATEDVSSSKKTGKYEEAPALEIWHSKDEVIIPAQKKSRMRDIERTQSGLWIVSANSYVALTDATVETAQIQSNNDIIVGTDGDPYIFEAMFGRPNNDLYTINIKTGKKHKVLEKISRAYAVSPNNKFFVYLKKDNLHLFNIESGESKNLTENIDGTFINVDDDHPLPQKRAHGFAGWAADNSSFLINEKYDVWQFFTNGKQARKLTNGSADKIRYRLHKMDYKEPHLNLKGSQYFSMSGLWSKKSGYAYGQIGKVPTTLIYEDAAVGRPTKAENNEVFIYTKGSFEDSPNLFITNTLFENSKKISNTNPFQDEYAWGKAELVEFTNAIGKTAQGILYYPANYEKGKKYPMITYIYEKLSQGLHRYHAPSSTNYYSTQVWSQNGYFVFNPDIDFIAGDPGVSSARTLENAVAAVVELGDVDAKKVGLIGHSWGGYQAGYVPTQTDIFAASVAGAGLTNFISMNLAVTPGFGGMPENNHFEVGQERMISPPWVSPENYVRNSSVMNVHKLNTPILFEVGDNDNNVDWRQGIEYYNAARRANKPFVLLVYAKEGHGLRSKKNTTDYQQRILKWFGHYLKGEPAEDWIHNGVPYAEQQKRLKNWNK